MYDWKSGKISTHTGRRQQQTYNGFLSNDKKVSIKKTKYTRQIKLNNIKIESLKKQSILDETKEQSR